MKVNQFVLLYFILISMSIISIAQFKMQSEKILLTKISLPSNEKVIAVCSGNDTYGIATRHEFFMTNKKNNEIIKVITTNNDEMISSLQVSTQGIYLLLYLNARETYDAEFYNEKGQLISQINGIETGSVEFSRDGNHLFMFRNSLLNDHVFKTYEVSTGKQIELPFSVNYPRFISEFIDEDKVVVVFFRQRTLINEELKGETTPVKTKERVNRLQRGFPDRKKTTKTHATLPSLLIIYDLVTNTYIEKELITSDGDSFIINWDAYKKIIPLKEKFILLGKKESRNLESLSLSDYALIINDMGVIVEEVNINFANCNYCGVGSFLTMSDNKVIILYKDKTTSKLLKWNLINNEFDDVYLFNKKNSLTIKTGFFNKRSNELYIDFLGEHNLVVFNSKNKKIIEEIKDGLIIQGQEGLLYLGGTSKIVKVIDGGNDEK